MTAQGIETNIDPYKAPSPPTLSQTIDDRLTAIRQSTKNLPEDQFSNNLRALLEARLSQLGVYENEMSWASGHEIRKDSNKNRDIYALKFLVEDNNNNRIYEREIARAIRSIKPESITSLDDFIEMSYLDTDDDNRFFNAMTSSFPLLIKSSEDFIRTCCCIFETKHATLLKTMRPYLKEQILNATDVIMIFKVLNKKLHASFYEIMQAEIPGFIKSAEQFTMLFNFLPAKQRTDFYEKMKDRLPSLIQSGDDFISVFNLLSKEQRASFYTDNIKGSIANDSFKKSTLEDFKKALTNFADDNHLNDFYAKIETSLCNKIVNASDRIDIYNLLPFPTNYTFYEKTNRERTEHPIQDSDNLVLSEFTRAYCILTEEAARRKLYGDFKASLIATLNKSKDFVTDFSKLFSVVGLIPVDEQSIYQSLKDKLLKINTFADMLKVLKSIPQEHRCTLYDIQKNDFFTYAKCIDNTKRLKTFFEQLTPFITTTQFVELCECMKEDLSQHIELESLLRLKKGLSEKEESNIQEIFFNSLLGQLAKKRNDFSENYRSHPEAASAATILHSSLKKASESYFHKGAVPSSREKLVAFKEKCTIAINNAHELKNHRGYKDIVPKFLLFFVALFNVIKDKLESRTPTYRVFKTSSEKLLDKFSQVINDLDTSKPRSK